jgi:hypothetical protein
MQGSGIFMILKTSECKILKIYWFIGSLFIGSLGKWLSAELSKCARTVFDAVHTMLRRAQHDSPVTIML